MNLKNLTELSLPDSPGVYFFRRGREILYIGKATSLKDRVRSYFSNDIFKTRGPRIVDMVTTATTVTYTTTNSVLEALLLETALIKKHTPYFNTKEKDDKSFNCVVVTDELYPRVLLVRHHDIIHDVVKFKMKHIFGPFPHGSQLKQALKIIQKIFPFFSTNFVIDPDNKAQEKSIKLNIQIGLYPDIYSGTFSRKDYVSMIKKIILLFNGSMDKVIKNLTNDMNLCVKQRKFEEAQKIKHTLFALSHIQDVALIKETTDPSLKNFRIEGYDISHLSGTNPVGVMTVVENGAVSKSEYKKFTIKSARGGDDMRSLEEVLDRRLKHAEWQYPDLIVIDGGKVQYAAALAVITKYKLTKSIKVVSVVKDEKHQADHYLGDAESIERYKKEIILVNAEAHRFAVSFQRKKRSRFLTK